jgi:hypothetical protein
MPLHVCPPGAQLRLDGRCDIIPSVVSAAVHGQSGDILPESWLVTQFSITGVPEPTSASWLGLAQLLARRRQ